MIGQFQTNCYFFLWLELVSQHNVLFLIRGKGDVWRRYRNLVRWQPEWKQAASSCQCNWGSYSSVKWDACRARSLCSLLACNCQQSTDVNKFSSDKSAKPAVTYYLQTQRDDKKSMLLGQIGWRTAQISLSTKGFSKSQTCSCKNLHSPRQTTVPGHPTERDG